MQEKVKKKIPRIRKTRDESPSFCFFFFFSFFFSFSFCSTLRVNREPAATAPALIIQFAIRALIRRRAFKTLGGEAPAIRALYLAGPY